MRRIGSVGCSSLGNCVAALPLPLALDLAWVVRGARVGGGGFSYAGESELEARGAGWEDGEAVDGGTDAGGVDKGDVRGASSVSDCVRARAEAEAAASVVEGPGKGDARDGSCTIYL